MGTVELQLRDQIAKRCMDVVGAVIGCIISIPIIAVVAIPLKLEAPARCFLNKSVWAATGGIFTSTSCAACTWTPRPARRS